MALERNPPISKEMRDLKKLLKQIPDDRKAVAQSLYNELFFMDGTLTKLRNQILEEGPTSVLIQGPQEMPVQHPALKAYVALIQRFGVIYKQLTDLLPQSEGTKEKDALLEFLKKYQ